jgi:hypothetical protein
MTELEADVRFRYDLETFTARHPQANVFRLLNDAMRDFRDRLTVDGSSLFLTSMIILSSAVGPSAYFPGTLIPFGSTKFTFVRDVHLLEGTSWLPLREISYDDALNWTDLSSNSQPRAWCLAGVDVESAASTTTGQSMQIMVVPPNNTTRSYRVVGLATVADLGANDRVMTDLGMHEYAIRWVGLQLATRDDDVALWQARSAELQQCYQDSLKRAKNRTPGHSRRTDTRTRGTQWRW